MEYKVLKINGAILSQNELETYLQKVASDHSLQNKSNKNTYPIPRLKENFELITDVYHMLNEHIKLNIPIHPAGEWILDNYYVIEENVKAIKNDLTLKKYTHFLGIQNGIESGFARSYVLASEIVNYTDNKIDNKNLKKLLQAYQTKKTLSMEEIWNISTFLQIALIENIRQICEKIYGSQMQKYKVENIMERLVEHKENLQFTHLHEYQGKIKQAASMKYAFIEYLSYRLKKYGRKAYPFLNILEEQVNRMGMTVDEVIEKEHFDIALRKISMGNAITSIKTLNRMSMVDIFEEINGVEETLKQDPAGIYEKIDYQTKVEYRNIIKQISQKTNLSEIYIAKKCLQLGKDKTGKKAHIGYYLMDQGKQELYELLTGKKQKELSYDAKAKLYVGVISFFTVLTTSLISIKIYQKTTSASLAILLWLLLLIPTQTIWVQIIQAVLGKLVKPKKIPKLDMQDGIPEQYATFVVIPTILKSKEKVEELMKKLEVYSYANQSENLYFALLGDCSSGKNEKEPFDEEVVASGLRMAEQLNKKHPNEVFPKFHFCYRKRTWNAKEECYLGWERKRGLLNQWNEYLLGNEKNEFLVNTVENWKQKDGTIPHIQYIITLDADTDLTLNSGLELVGAMAHILNTPVLNEGKDCVIDGHALLQPRIGIDLMTVLQTPFTTLYAGAGGKDAYTNAISDTYQDNFNEGIFTGKGIYDLAIFSTVLGKEIPENTVLSHDLLEGNYLRAGLATDIMLMDGYPAGYSSFKTRQHRWIRGDWQIIGWLKGSIKNKEGIQKQNPLNFLSKYKIWDNLVRSLQEPMMIISFIVVSLICATIKANLIGAFAWLLLSAIIPSLLELVMRMLFRKEEETAQKTFTKTISGVRASIIRAVLAIGTLPDKAYMSLNACVKTLYRILVSKKHFLEWMTAEEAEKTAKKDIMSYYFNMLSNVIISIFAFLLLWFLPQRGLQILLIALAILWLATPAILCQISKKAKAVSSLEKLSEKDKQYLLEAGKRTWQYFKDFLIEENHYLPPDNYQEDRRPKIVARTSSTNIGLGLLSVISSYDLGYETLEDTCALLQNMLQTIESLPKWNGHLYNWYDLVTLQPLKPRYVSSVDSGNFVGYLYVVKQFLEELPNEKRMDLELENVEKIIQSTDFSTLYDEENRLFSIGFNVEENALTDSYYDLLASEARQASLVAIAKKDISSKHWSNLSRTLTILNQYKGLVSWSGTAFEYFMPNINIPKYPGSLLAESCCFMLMSQKEYAKKLNIPWGISESAFYLKDLNNNYQYKAFGIPWLGLKRGLSDEIVVSSYASSLALPDIPQEVVQNLKELQKRGMYQKYGFYEAIDYTPTRVRKGKEYELVKTYMAHHEALILLSINNLFHDNVLQKRFMQNPEMQAIQILLQEKMPENIIITKEEKEKVEKMKYVDYESYTQREITKLDNPLPQINVIANGEYTIVMDSKGLGYSKYGNIYLNRYKPTSNVEQGIFFFFKNIKTKRTWASNHMSYLAPADKYTMYFTPDMHKIVRQDGNIETTTKISISPDEPVEIRKIEMMNHGIEEETIEVTSFLEPILSTPNQDYAHPAFNNLFLNMEWIDEKNIMLLTKRKRSCSAPEICAAVSFYTENETIGELEYEIDKEKFQGRNSLNLPKAVENSTPFSKQTELTTDPIVSFKRTVVLKPEQKVSFTLLLAVGTNRQEVLSNLSSFQNQENIDHTLELSKAKVEAENRYLGVKGKEIDTYQKLLGYLLVENPFKAQMANGQLMLPASELWKYGISGDLPILLVSVKEETDVDVVTEVLKAYEYFRIKNINIDLVIINEEQYSYESLAKEAIMNSIFNQNLGYLQNIQGGIFVLENLEAKEIDFLKARANFIVQAHDGSLARNLKDLEEEYLENYREMPKDEIPRRVELAPSMRAELPNQNLKYYNEYGGFTEDGKEYHIRINKDKKLPTVWSHILTNGQMGTLVTESLGGYTWYQNSRLNRLTAWNNDQVQDVPSEVIYLKDEETKTVWSMGASPCPDENDYDIIYGFGYAKYQHTSRGLGQKLDMFIPEKDNVKVQIVRLENNELKKKKLKLYYYLKPVMGDDELHSKGYLQLQYDQNLNLLCLENLSQEESEYSQIMFVSSSEKITSYTGSKQSFFGRGNLSNPEGVHQIKLDGENSLWKEGVIAVECEVTLEALESKNVIFTLGIGSNKIDCQDLAYQYTNFSNVWEKYAKTKQYWKEQIETLQVTTPLESTNLLLNGWLIYQVLASRILGRTGFYQSGGAFGFRDQLQDTLALKYFSPEWMKEQIIRASRHQFIEGDVLHWWHEESKRGIRTRFSDDRLWLVYLVEDYVSFTGDSSILDIKTPYLAGEPLEEGVDEKYDLYLPSNIEATIYEHCKKAIAISLQFGKNELTKIGSGDWNDGFSTVGNQGKGESVWLGFFLYAILDKFIPLCRQKGEEEVAQQYAEIMEKLKKALNHNGWDGRWFKRAFMDNGDILGSIQNEECRIDSIAQSWATISRAGDNDKKYISMESLENHLVDTTNGIIKLLDPPFDKSSLEPGYIKAYVPGTRENGGQYTHGAIWAVISEAMLGFGDKAGEYYRMINPIEHSRTKETAKKYKVEPYVISADVYGQGNLAGRGGWTWYTGSASWMDEAGIKYLLGLQIENKALKINPCIPSTWKEYTMRYKWNNTIYHIHVSNPNGKCTGISSMKVNGNEIANQQVPLTENAGVCNVEILM